MKKERYDMKQLLLITATLLIVLSAGCSLTAMLENASTRSCGKCDGAGKITCTECGGNPLTCAECEGKGETDCNECKSIFGCAVCQNTTKVDCDACNGAGTLACTTCNNVGKIKCSTCKGTGKKQ